MKPLISPCERVLPALSPATFKEHIRTAATLSFGILLIASASAQVPNGGFESWVDQGTYLDPAGWLTYNDVFIDTGHVITVERGFPGAVGAFHAVITTRAMPVGTALQGWLSLNGFPLADRPAQLVGQWQYGIQPADTGVVSVLLSKWNSGTGARELMAHGELKVTGTLSGWHPLSVPITYFSAEVPDSAYIQFEASFDFADPVPGSFIKVDDLAFTGVVGVAEAGAKGDLRLYPSPATGPVHITADRRIMEVQVLDLTGRVVLAEVVQAEMLDLDLSALHAGQYLVHVQFANGERQVRAVVKQ